MANNITVKNALGNNVDVKTTDTASVHVPHHNIDTLIPGTAATSLGKAEDAAHTTGDTGVMVLAVQRATRAVGSADGDYSTLNVDAQGNLYVVGSQKRLPFSAVPATAAGAYAAADVVGTLMTISNAVRFSGGSGVIESIVINDKANVISNIDVIFFGANPSASTFTDNGAYTVNVADWDKIIAAENVNNSFPAAGNRCLKYTPPAGVPFALSTGTDIYAVLVARTGFTLVSATDLKLSLVIRQD